jgi:hypothetical protein
MSAVLAGWTLPHRSKKIKDLGPAPGFLILTNLRVAMADQFSGTMMRSLSDAVDKALPEPNKYPGINIPMAGGGLFHIGPEVDLVGFRQALLNTPDDWPFPKAEYLELIDLSLSENPDPAKISASLEKLKRLPPLPGNAKAISIGPR